jgi:hypothetical protein
MGKWLDRLLAKSGCAPPEEPTKPTKPTKPGCVGFVSALRSAHPEIAGAPPVRSAPPAVVEAWPPEANPADPEAAERARRRGWRIARLLAWGWKLAAAEALAARLAQRDAKGDDRAACVECRHWRPSRCANHVAAGLLSANVGGELARMLQRCPGFGATGGGCTPEEVGPIALPAAASPVPSPERAPEPEDALSLREAIEERAAILEFDAGMTRAQAEETATALVAAERRPPSAPT